LKDDSFDCTLIAHLRIFLLFYRLLYCLILPENRLFFGIWKVVEIEAQSAFTVSVINYGYILAVVIPSVVTLLVLVFLNVEKENKRMRELGKK